ncbi:MAG: DUF3891 family protein [Verrucomicrobiae bacterium]|nr:DUF3891 family protein [Verrucomicrobiae bacterium]
MVHRREASGLVVVTQPAHAWISGQLARAWGNARFGSFEPHEEVCLAAEQHDCGWHEWEIAPTLDRGTGLPHHFDEMPLREHLRVWPAGVGMVGGMSRYAGLLVCLHGLWLRERNDEPKDPAEQHMVRGFVECQQLARDTLLDALRREGALAPHCTGAAIARNQALVAAWDWLSLGLCMNSAREWLAPDVPDAGGRCTLRMTPEGDSGRDWRVVPWPFRAEGVDVFCEGRRLNGTFVDVEPMRAALAAAPRVRLEFRLRP